MNNVKMNSRDQIFKLMKESKKVNIDKAIEVDTGIKVSGIYISKVNILDMLMIDKISATLQVDPYSHESKIHELTDGTNISILSYDEVVDNILDIVIRYTYGDDGDTLFKKADYDMLKHDNSGLVQSIFSAITILSKSGEDRFFLAIDSAEAVKRYEDEKINRNLRIYKESLEILESINDDELGDFIQEIEGNKDTNNKSEDITE